MNITAVATNRYVNNWPSWHLIHEWEDDFAYHLQIPLKGYSEPGKIKRNVSDITSYWFTRNIPNKFLRLLRQPQDSSDKYLIFELTQKITYSKSFSTDKRAIPVIIDFFCRPEKLKHFYNAYRQCDLVLISSIEAYNYLKHNNCPLPIFHFPLSLSDKYKPGLQKLDKTIDILIAGRYSLVLWEFLQRFSEKYPDIEYVYRTVERGIFYYHSNKKGNMGEFSSRASFTELLKSSKISFYSTPGIDGGEVRTAGFNPVTPRYLELLSARCFLLGRYPDNDETRYYELPSVCPHVSTYEEFEKVISTYLSKDEVDSNLYNAILNKHYTSERVKLLNKILLQQE